MKYIKKYESVQKTARLETDIKYLSNIQGTQKDEYIVDVIEHYKMTNEQVHNLKSAVQYNYLNYKDFRNVVNEVINFDHVWSEILSEKKFKVAYESNFKNKIIECDKPYKICVKNKYYLESISDLYSFDLNDIIGEISKEYPFGKRYVIGQGRYRGNDNNRETLWEEFRGTKRESEFIKVFDEDQIIILTDEDIKNIEMRSNANKYNL